MSFCNRMFTSVFMASLGAVGAEIVVSDAALVTYTSAADVIVAQTVKAGTNYPASVGMPAFWLDASDTNGWEFTAGTRNVTKVPSKGTSSRYMSIYANGGDWTGWGSTATRSPVFEPNDATLGGRPMLDFGAAGSARGLVFDPDSTTATATYPNGYNAMTNIGTVVAVWGSANGGGHLMGGGVSGDFLWHRGQCMTDTPVSALRYANPVGVSHMQDVAEFGVIRHDGLKTAPTLMGFNHTWEVVSLQCTANTAQATGFGVNDKRSNMSWVSGGMQIAEVLIYDRVLTDAEVLAVEMYLESKWFGRGRTGVNGTAKLGTLSMPTSSTSPTVATILVPAGETLEIGRVEGGRVKGAGIIKEGDGALVLAGAGAYAGTMTLNAGVLSFPALKTPPADAAALPHDLYARFDASAPDSLVTTQENGTNFVSVWRNLADGATAYGRSFCLRPLTTARRPWLLADVLGGDKPVIDFGVLSSTGPYLAVQTNELGEASNTKEVSLGSISTVVAVIGAHKGGGNLLGNNALKRKSPADAYFKTPVLYHDVLAASPKVPSEWGDFYTDGVRTDGALGYDRPGYQVVAFRLPGGNFSRVGYASGDGRSGGLRLGELLIWNRVLTEEEVHAATAYLEAKWFNRGTPGFGVAEKAPIADVQHVKVGQKANIHVGAGRTARIDRLDSVSDVVKTGEGRLEIGAANFSAGSQLKIMGGSAAVVGARDSAASVLAPGAVKHLDASDKSHMDIVVCSDGVEEIDHWHDPGFANGLWAYAANLRPYLNTTDLCNGLPVADFGRMSSATPTHTITGGGRWMAFERPLHSIRSIYMVVGMQAGGGFLFGGSAGDPMRDVDSIDFHAAYKTIDGKTVYSGPAGLFQGYGVQDPFSISTGGAMFTNGVQLASLATPMPTNCYFLLELHTSAGVSASQIARDRNLGDRMGGFRVGELLVYEHVLSAREKVATRNYLMRKWFDADPVELPDAPDVTELPLRELEVNKALAHDADAAEEYVRLTGEGVFTKTGAGALTFADLSSFSGSVNVAAGALKVTGCDPYAAAELVEEGIIYHADATTGLTTTTNANGVICVSTWQSRAADGTLARRSGGNADCQKVVFDRDVGYRPTVDMNGYNACFVFEDGTGAHRNLAGIKSAFWMIGSQNGGGFLMGGGTNAAGELTYAWHRGIFNAPNPSDPTKTISMVGTTNLCPILHSGAAAAARTANWWKNGDVISYGNGLSGKWDQLSMVVKNEEDSVNADGLAYDGRSRKPSGATNHEYSGHQRLAELICYDRRLSDAERKKVECYLSAKWLNGMHPVAKNVQMNIASGAVLDLDGGTQWFAGLSGAGSVQNGTLKVGGLVADAAATAWPRVDGTFAVEPGQPVALANFGEMTAAGTRVKVLTAANFVGVENLAGAVFSGDPRVSAKARLMVIGDTLEVVLVKVGMSLNFR